MRFQMGRLITDLFAIQTTDGGDLPRATPLRANRALRDGPVIPGVAFVSLAALAHYLLIAICLRLPFKTEPSESTVVHSWLNGLVQWDSLWYLAIGRFGYKLPLAAQKTYLAFHATVPLKDPLQATAFFPGLPVLIHFIGLYGTLLLGNLVFFFSLVLLFRLIWQVNPRLAAFGVLFYALNPASIYESNLYPEVYSVFCSMLIVYAIGRQKQSWDMIACLGAALLGTFHELGCLGAIVGLRYLRIRRFLQAFVFVLCAGLGWLIQLIYLGFRYHRPLAAFAAEHHWNFRFEPPGTALLVSLFNPRYFDVQVFVVLGMFVLTILYVVWVLKRDKTWEPTAPLNITSAEVGLWVGVFGLIGSSTYVVHFPLMSAIRFFSVLWPIYTVPWITVIQGAYRQWLRLAILLGSTAATAWGTILFTHGYFYQ
ncbi:MAG: hypothetical protein K6T83_10070 [Alicyclobacillus sp.]|nr:hypothetical protein [Alicyclobacillus sp.]